MEVITLLAIAQKLQAAITEKISREDTANWALKVREAIEAKKISSEPARDESIIWDAILYVEGIDLQDAPESYLHDKNDLISYLHKIN